MNSSEEYTLHCNRLRYQSEWAERLKDPTFDTFITLAFEGWCPRRNQIILANLDSYSAKFHMNLDEFFFGQGYYKIQDCKEIFRSRFIGFVEFPLTKMHIHMLASISPTRRCSIHDGMHHAMNQTFFGHFKQLLPDERFVTRGLVSIDIQPITTEAHRKAVRYYITKDHADVLCHPHLFLSESTQT